MPYVYSTASNDMIYTEHKRDGSGNIPEVTGQVLIRGRANIAQGPLGGLVTKYGMRTEVSDEELALLERNSGFKEAEAKGFHLVSARKVKAEVAAADMTGRDKSAPVVPQDFDEDGKVKPRDAAA